jgi:hypothetical protein
MAFSFFKSSRESDRTEIKAEPKPKTA